MIYVYAISSCEKDYLYVGMTNNLTRRLRQHNKGYSRSTKPYAPFNLIYTKSFPDRQSARIHEKEMKTGAGKRKLTRLRDQGEW